MLKCNRKNNDKAKKELVLQKIALTFKIFEIQLSILL